MATYTTLELYNAFEQMSGNEQTELYKLIRDKIENIGNDIVAYTINGQPLTRAQYMAEINEGIEQGECGETYSRDDIFMRMDA
jgi:hypothetical protein